MEKVNSYRVSAFIFVNTEKSERLTLSLLD
jgi:hypothetical protein